MLPIRLFLFLVLAVSLAGCSSRGGGEGEGWVTYTDAQGNLVTVPTGEAEDEEAAGEQDTRGEEGPSPACESGGCSDAPQDQEPAEVYRETGPFGVGSADYSIPEADTDSPELDEAIRDEYRDRGEAYEQLQQEHEQRERDRFVTWHLPDGTPVVEPFDAIEAREQRERERRGAIRPLDDDDGGRPWVETAMPLRADCCVDVVDSLPLLEAGSELVFSFAERKATVEVDGRQFRVVGARLAPEVREVRMQTFIRGGGYIHPHMLLLDREGRPELAVNNLFTNRHSATWYRHGFLAGRLELDPEHEFLVLYLPYEQGLDTGFVPETDLSLESRGEVVIRGRE